MNLLIAYLVVFLLGATPFLEVVGVIPIGVAAGLPALPVAILAFSGNILTIWLLILMTARVKEWLKKRKDRSNKSQKKEERAATIWKKYGLPGLAIVSPILIGSHLGAILAISFGGTRKQITLWMTGSILFWTIAMGIASYYGLNLLFNQSGYEGFLSELIQTDK